MHKIREKDWKDRFGEMPCVLRSASSVRLLMDEGVRAIYARFGVPRPPCLPRTPSRLKITRCKQLKFVDCEGEDWPVIDCPKRFPRTARFVCGLGSAYSPFHSWEDGYSITTNKGRSHWILWMLYEDPYYYTKHKHPIAWCKRTGISEHDVCCYLLRAWWESQRDESDMKDYVYVVADGKLSHDEINVLRNEVWPEEEK